MALTGMSGLPPVDLPGLPFVPLYLPARNPGHPPWPLVCAGILPVGFALALSKLLVCPVAPRFLEAPESRLGVNPAGAPALPLQHPHSCCSVNRTGVGGSPYTSLGENAGPPHIGTQSPCESVTHW